MTDKTDKPANRMWGGRFKASPAEIMEQINASIGFDKRLAPQDIRASKAHAQMLAAQGIITKADAREIVKGLDAVLAEIESGDMEFQTALEDVHMNVESRLKELIGTPAGRLHTARSRNDQVATDFKLWVRESIDALDEGLARLQLALVEEGGGARRDRHAGLHASAAGAAGDVRPSSAGLRGDAGARPRALCRRTRAAQRVSAGRGGAGRDVVPDRPRHDGGGARFDRPAANSLDAVSDRDFVLETLAAATITRGAPVALRRGGRAVVDAAVRIHPAVG